MTSQIFILKTGNGPFYILDSWKLKKGTITNKPLCPETPTVPQWKINHAATDWCVFVRSEDVGSDSDNNE